MSFDQTLLDVNPHSLSPGADKTAVFQLLSRARKLALKIRSSMSVAAQRDLIVLCALALIAYLYSVSFDIFDHFIQLLSHHEEWEADEIIAAIMIAMIGVAVFAVRRTFESVRDLKRRITAEEEVKALAMHDALTGLPNRRKLEMELSAARHEAARGDFIAVASIDLDRFKPVNDLYGHAAGDDLLINIAEMIQKEIGDKCLAARIGGDEFILLLRGLENVDHALAYASHLCTLFAEPMIVGENEISVGATIGVVAPLDAAQSPSEILRRADIALYRAKSKGRGTFAFFNDAMDRQVQVRLELERQLREAVARETIEPFFQELIDLKTDAPYGYEVLARLRNSDGGITPPDSFIPMAEEIGLIGEMTLSLLRRACIEARDWPGAPLLSVNISPIHLREAALPQQILKILMQSGFPAKRLQVEVTETALVADLEQARVALSSLQNQGVLIALDDFGTGYSSLRHLRELPFNSIKIDRSFVQSMNESADAQTLVRTIIYLADVLGLSVTAEGVETEEDVRLLKEFGCASGQGYLFGRPVDGAHIRAKLAPPTAGAAAPAARRGYA